MKSYRCVDVQRGANVVFVKNAVEEGSRFSGREQKRGKEGTVDR